ncbi:hypothetical protein M0804_001569 [Polistes exclamans]|nr:hypothetical protein M0804_001569 [Polistes exclamans]
MTRRDKSTTSNATRKVDDDSCTGASQTGSANKCAIKLEEEEQPYAKFCPVAATTEIDCGLQISFVETDEEEVKDVRGDDDDDDEDEEKVIGKDANSFKSISCVASSSFLKMKNVWGLKSIVCKMAPIVLSALYK